MAPKTSTFFGLKTCLGKSYRHSMGSDMALTAARASASADVPPAWFRFWPLLTRTFIQHRLNWTLRFVPLPGPAQTIPTHTALLTWRSTPLRKFGYSEHCVYTGAMLSFIYSLFGFWEFIVWSEGFRRCIFWYSYYGYFLEDWFWET